MRLILLASVFLAGCTRHLALYDSSYRGQVVDADTGEPIEGVVALVVWYTEYLTVAGAMHDYYDARETVTDENGEFVLPGMGARVVSNLTPVRLMIFKAGYEFLDADWDALKTERPLRYEVKWEDDKPILIMKKLTMTQRKKQYIRLPPDEAPKEKIRLMIDEINKDSKEQGLKGTIDIGR